ncbi:MAG: type II secretion system F family protein [Erysipelotrichaceae bacterium]|nr:type II secretion system F family protein [Erysipelotrichaceae bacterium]MDD3924271.1 type II secretion system F family protein [Erysipelotrichaceae bacterium]MDD4642894.1 type II secretion system F family protein [Erysipelotrichaceae bacterium]
MKSFSVTLLDDKGKTIRDIYQAETPQDLIQAVKAKDLYLLDYQEQSKAPDVVSKLKLKSVVIFCRQLGTMIKAGIPIIQALEMLRNKADNAKSLRIFNRIYEDVQKGNSLSKSMEMQKGAFPNLLINMILAGELGGTLDESLMRMADHYEKELKINSKIRSSSLYPIILGIVSIAVILLLVIFVLPTITAMFAAEDMPWTTKIILDFSYFLINNWLTIIVVLLLIFVTIRLSLNIQQIRVKFDKTKLFLPIIGKLNQTIYSARCARALASLYSSGVQTIDMLETTSQVLNNAYLEEVFVDVIMSVSKGELISKAINDTSSFDPMLSSMIYIGEESGSLGDILNSTADYFDNEADVALQRMVSLMEPIMIVVLGIVIGFIVISIIQPIFQMYQSIGA